MSVLTPEIRKRIEAYIPRYPSKQAVTLPALHIVQDEMRCVPMEAIREIAEMLDLSPAAVDMRLSRARQLLRARLADLDPMMAG